MQVHSLNYPWHSQPIASSSRNNVSMPKCFNVSTLQLSNFGIDGLIKMLASITLFANEIPYISFGLDQDTYAVFPSNHGEEILLTRSKAQATSYSLSFAIMASIVNPDAPTDFPPFVHPCVVHHTTLSTYSAPQICYFDSQLRPDCGFCNWYMYYLLGTM